MRYTEYHAGKAVIKDRKLLPGAMEKLAAYENTGLTPEQIMRLKGNMNDGWIPADRLPPNAKYIGALCPRYQLYTKYGVTEGWYNPDLESWFVLVWFMTERYLDSEIDFERGSHPKIVRFGNEVSEKHRVVLAWQPLPEPYRPKKESEGSRRLREREEFFKE